MRGNGQGLTSATNHRHDHHRLTIFCDVDEIIIIFAYGSQNNDNEKPIDLATHCLDTGFEVVVHRRV